MSIFEDDAINDDFEVEISDLDPEEAHPLSSAIALLRSRIFFNASEDITEETFSDDDFELEITDLPADEEESRIPAAIAALRSRISFSPRPGESNDVSNDNFELEITDLPATDNEESVGARFIAPPRSAGRDKSGPYGQGSRLPRKVQMLRLVSVGVAIFIMLAVVMQGVPSAREAVLGLFPRPTATPSPISATRAFPRLGDSFLVVVGGNISISSTPIAGVTIIPWNPNTPIANVLNSAPAECPFYAAPQDPDGNDFSYGSRVGEFPLWVMGFRGVPTRLIGFTRANPPQYGWVHQVTLLLEGSAYGPVMLQGTHLKDGTPLLFSGQNSQQHPTTFLTVRLDAGATSNPEGTVLAGIGRISLYIPTAGCYSLKASWAGGSWEVIFAAGQ